MPDVQAAQQAAGDGGMGADNKTRRAQSIPGALWTPLICEPMGGKIPFIGASIWYWYTINDFQPGRGSLRPMVGHLVEPSHRNTGLWHIVFFSSGDLPRTRREVPFSDKPRAGYWSWPIDPNVASKSKEAKS